MIVRRPYAHLEEELRRIGNVTVIVDRRDGERRALKTPATIERRHAERRRVREELGEMVMVIDGC